jgi:putative methyltransferase (TIGR04325 family)
MKISFKSFIKLILPPIFLIVYRKIQNNRTETVFKGNYDNFNEIYKNNKGLGLDGYDNKQIIDLERDSIYSGIRKCASKKDIPCVNIRSQITNLLPILIAAKGGRMSVLDFGGGAGTGFLDCCSKTNMDLVNYYIHDLRETMIVGRDIFNNQKNKFNNVYFIENIENIENIDLVYFGSSLQYIQDYKVVLESLIKKNITHFFFTDNFMGPRNTFATIQVNLHELNLAYWIFQLQEIKDIFKKSGYKLVYKSSNFQPFHILPKEFSIDSSCNLLFSKE